MRPRQTVGIELRKPDSVHFLEPLLPLFKLAFREANGLRARFDGQHQRALCQGLAGNPAARILLASTKGRTVGLALCFVRPEPAIGGDVLELHELVVLSAWRGRGIGAQLMRRVDGLARQEECKKITLALTVDNVIGQRLCRHLGFHHCHPPRYFMEKELAPGGLAGTSAG